MYASPDYLLKQGEPQNAFELSKHIIIGFSNKTTLSEQHWTYSFKNKYDQVLLTPNFHSNDIESSLTSCIAGYGIGRFTELNTLKAVSKKQLKSILNKYDWGDYNLFAIYSNQQNLPTHTRLFLDFITAHMQEKLTGLHPII